MSSHAPRYIAYCVAKGLLSPAERKALDASMHGRNWMLPYVYWISHQTDDWCKETGTIRAEMGFAEHTTLTEWLIARYPVPKSKPRVLTRAVA
ncbi:MAG: hypothetical protein M3O74_13785 [Pseudomonadota bacterium]|nr:hypothetical protein [Pseudomonadota bacterium]